MHPKGLLFVAVATPWFNRFSSFMVLHLETFPLECELAIQLPLTKKK